MDFNAILQKLKPWSVKLGFTRKPNDLDDLGPLPPKPISERRAMIANTASSLTRILTGSINEIGEFYFPPDIIGGTCPRVAGEEEEIVWNAAAEACDSERVHVVWQSTENKVWYLAVRSIELSSRADSWCPFAALLPGMRDAKESPVCYTYYGDDIATMMTVTVDSLQIYRGTNLVVRAKAERTARELGNAPIIELLPEKIAALLPTPWYSLSLFEDRARRMLAAIAVIGALSLTALAFLVWVSASLSLIAARSDLSSAQAHTRDKSSQLMYAVEQLRASPLRQQLSEFSDLNDGLITLNGFLEVYEAKGDKARWRAVVPTNVTADRINAIGGKTIETRADGTVIGNANEVAFEASGGKK